MRMNANKPNGCGNSLGSVSVFRLKHETTLKLKHTTRYSARNMLFIEWHIELSWLLKIGRFWLHKPTFSTHLIYIYIYVYSVFILWESVWALSLRYITATGVEYIQDIYKCHISSFYLGTFLMSRKTRKSTCTSGPVPNPWISLLYTVSPLCSKLSVIKLR